MELHLNTVGVLLMLLSVSHLIFPRYFKWKNELSGLSHINRQMMYVHAFFIAFGVFLMGLLCLTSANELTDSILGQRISLGLGIFWVTRLFAQFFGYSAILWKGKRFETTVHLLLTGLWIYFSWTFLAIFFTDVK